MTETTILWLVDGTADSVSWIHPGATAEQAPEVRHGTLAEAADHAAGHVVVLVPSIHVLLTSVTIPTRNRQRLLAAVPNVLEDYLAADIEALHFAVGRHGPNGRVGVAVVAVEQMNAWLASLQEAGIRPAALVPDVLALPFEPDSWTVSEAGRYGLVRTGSQTGFAGDLNNLPLLLESALEEAGELRPARLRVFEALPLIDRLGSVEIGIDRESLPVLQAIAAEFDENSALNLLQGEFSRREQIGRVWRPWRATAALLGVFVLFHIISTVVDYVRLSQQDRKLRAEIEQIYQSTLPDSRLVPGRARAQMEQQLNALRNASGSAGGGLLALLAGIGQPLAETAGLELQRLSYRDGQIDLALVIKDLQNLDRLKQQLSEQPGIQVEIQSASARENQVEARLQIKGRSS